MSLALRAVRLRASVARSFSSVPPTSGTSDAGLGILSGAPEKHMVRSVRIWKPTKVATQQGRGSITQVWRMKFDKIQGDDRWTNPLMGWTSTSDPLSTLEMSFPTQEAAVEYAERHGFKYNVVQPEVEKLTKRKIAPFGRSMVHHWKHDGIPKYGEDA